MKLFFLFPLIFLPLTNSSKIHNPNKPQLFAKKDEVLNRLFIECIHTGHWTDTLDFEQYHVMGPIIGYQTCNNQMIVKYDVTHQRTN